MSWMILPKFALKSLEARDSRFAKAAAGMSLVNDHHNLDNDEDRDEADDDDGHHDFHYQ